MADKKFSELTTSAALTNDDIMAVVQMQSGALTSVKATLYAIAVHITKLAQYTSDLQTTDKTIIGAINELKRLIALIPGFNIVKVNSLPTEDIDTHTLYLVPSQDPEAQNSCDEYINTDGTTAGWELVGSTNIDLSDYYTKLEVDGLLADKLEADDFEANQTASANPITLETKQAGLAKSCVVEMKPIQDLHGYSNPWAGGAGKNKFDKSTVTMGKMLTNTGSEYTTSVGSYSDYIPIVLGTPYYFSHISGVGAFYSMCVYDANKAFLENVNIQGAGDASGTVTFTQGAYIRVNVYQANLDTCQIELGSTATSYAPYSNICPISGRTEASVTRTGKNLFNKSANDTSKGFFDNSYLWSNGTTRISNAWYISEYIRIYSALSLSGLPTSDASNPSYGFYTEDKTFISGGAYNNRAKIENFTIPENAYYFRISVPKANIDIVQVETNTTATAYEPYTAETHTKEFGQTVYGGSLDLNSGVLTITYGEVDLGDLTYTSESAIKDGQFFRNISSLDALFNSIPYCENYKGVKDRGAFNMNDGEIAITNSLAVPILRIYDSTKAGYTAEQFATAMSGVKFVFVLKTPIEAQLSPEAVKLLKGMNVISTDGDKVQVEFSDIPVGDYSTLLDYIKSLEERIKALEG